MRAADQPTDPDNSSPDSSHHWHDPGFIARFERDLSRLHPDTGRLGIAVSGGPDSLALLLLASAARPGQVEAATVDHGLRAESASEATMVAGICDELSVPHSVLRVTVPSGASVQARARQARYAALAAWAGECGVSAILTAHHVEDQAETLLMRLARGAGLPGLAGIRAVNRAGAIPVVRPLLGWRKIELEQLVRSAGITAVQDPANSDLRHDRTRARALLGRQEWPSSGRLAASAAHLAEAEEALAFSAERFFAERCRSQASSLQLDIKDLPRELQRRLLLLAIAALEAGPPRGPDLDRALTTLADGGTCTLAGIKLEGGALWSLSPAPPRR